MKSILKQVSREEMMRMRESGMTNMDIANSLGISYPTVYRYLGAQPSRGGRVAATIDTSKFKAVESEPVRNEPERIEEPALQVVNRTTSLAGIVAAFVVDAKCKMVTMTVDDVTIEVPFDMWSQLTNEVVAINRNLAAQTIAPEMW